MNSLFYFTYFIIITYYNDMYCVLINFSYILIFMVLLHDVYSIPRSVEFDLCVYQLVKDSSYFFFISYYNCTIRHLDILGPYLPLHKVAGTNL